MSQEIDKLFGPVSQQLAEAGSKLPQEVHLKCFRIGRALLKVFEDRAFDALDLLKGVKLDVAGAPENDPFVVLATRDPNYAFFLKVKGEAWRALLHDEEFTVEDLKDPDKVMCINVSLNTVLAFLHAERQAA